MQTQTLNKPAILAHLSANIAELKQRHEPELEGAAYWQAAERNTRDCINGDDLLNELCDVQELLAAYCRAGNTAKAGTLVQEVFDAFAKRLFERLYGDVESADVESAEEVGQRVEAAE